MKQSSTPRLTTAALIAALSLGLATPGAWAAHRSEAETAIAEARSVHQEAAAAGVADPETAALIEQAEGLLPSRQYTKAIGLAEKAMKADRYALSRTAKEGTAAPGPDAGGGPAAEAGKAIAAAEAARKKAASVGGEWRDTEQTIKEARDLLKSGEFDKAIALAEKARRQGENGYVQAMAEQDAGFPAYMLGSGSQ